jgi:hypothetical protein
LKESVSERLAKVKLRLNVLFIQGLGIYTQLNISVNAQRDLIASGGRAEIVAQTIALQMPVWVFTFAMSAKLWWIAILGVLLVCTLG